MEAVCTNYQHRQQPASWSTRDRGGEPANHSEAVEFSPSPGKFKPKKFAKTDVVKINQHLYIEIVPITVPCHLHAHVCRKPPAQLANHTSNPFCAQQVTLATRSCVGCKKWLPGEALEPHSCCVSCRPTMCLAADWCSECSHLSLLQFQAFVKDAEKHSAKEKKRAKSSGSSSEKHSCW
ncbi:hypothetical protein E2C01_063449 [Portunus trituberculatus]|uniref:Uncharacterized protein n=1 Tax=Portunus trituberculatus TaxID=210409 RepID=A0A5B7HDQ2_PORTR|nr:hypothetical protein [Portunus trituberculatus]